MSNQKESFLTEIESVLDVPVARIRNNFLLLRVPDLYQMIQIRNKFHWNIIDQWQRMVFFYNCTALINTGTIKMIFLAFTFFSLDWMDKASVLQFNYSQGKIRLHGSHGRDPAAEADPLRHLVSGSSRAARRSAPLPSAPPQPAHPPAQVCE